jgi:hypothetical protein
MKIKEITVEKPNFRDCSTVSKSCEGNDSYVRVTVQYCLKRYTYRDFSYDLTDENITFPNTKKMWSYTPLVQNYQDTTTTMKNCKL